MQVTATSSAIVGMRRAVAMHDAAADQVAQAGAVTVDSVLTDPPAADGLITAIPNLLLSRGLFTANAAVARTAHEAYQAALDIVRPR
jgi:hypothetical protein